MEIVESPKVDTKAVEKLEKKFEKAQETYVNHEYIIEFTKETMDYIKGDFAENVKFKGYSSYGIKAVFKAIDELKDGKGLWKHEFVEALFHFIKEHEGKGVKSANSHCALSDEISPVMEKVQINLQNLKDLATELEAAKQGLSVEEMLGDNKK